MAAVEHVPYASQLCLKAHEVKIIALPLPGGRPDLGIMHDFTYRVMITIDRYDEVVCRQVGACKSVPVVSLCNSGAAGRGQMDSILTA